MATSLYWFMAESTHPHAGGKSNNGVETEVNQECVSATASELSIPSSSDKPRRKRDGTVEWGLLMKHVIPGADPFMGYCLQHHQRCVRACLR